MKLASAMPELLTPNWKSTSNLQGIEHAVALLTASDDVKAKVQSWLDAGETV
jgi:hypothetical protein